MRTTAELFGGKRCVIFGVPGAFEPKVSEEYLKGFLEKHRDLKGSGAELIACISVNDPYVVKQWAQARYVGDSVLMLADPLGTFTEALGYLKDHGEFMGNRAEDFAFVLDQKMVCEYGVSNCWAAKQDAPEKLLGHFNFLRGTGFLEDAPSKAAALAQKAKMDSSPMQKIMAEAYDKARLETQEISRLKNDFVAKLEQAGRQATIRLKTMGEMGIAAFRADESSRQAKADSLPDEVFLRTAPMNLAKRNALEANRKQWGIQYTAPIRVPTGAKKGDDEDFENPHHLP